MAYTPTEWQSGDIVTSAKLNKIENGIASASAGGGVMYVTISAEDAEGEMVYSADKTLDEIIAAVESGQDVRATFADGGGYFYLITCADNPDGKTAAFNQTLVYPSEDSPTTAVLSSTVISINNDGSGDVVELEFVNGDITLTNS